MSWWNVRSSMDFALREGGTLPYVATVCGFVVAGADIAAANVSGTAVRPGKNPASASPSTVIRSSHPRANGWCDNARPTTLNVMFDLAPPGPWFDLVEGRRLPTGRGPAWRLWLPQ